jgi:phage-related minor tail protein
MADLERLGIVVTAEGIVELSDGTRLAGKEVEQLAGNLGDLGKELRNSVAQAKAQAEATKAVESAAKSAATSVGAQTAAHTTQAAGVREGSAALEHFSLNNKQAQREVIVLAHELSHGNFSKFGGSMMVLAEATGAASLLMSPLGLGIAAAALAAGGFAIAAYKGAQESNELGRSLVLTGGYAGVTAGGFEQMAARVADAAHSKIGIARQALADLVAGGRITGDALGVLTVAMTREATLTHQSLSALAKDYDKMPDGIAKWAAEHNKSMHFMSLAQYEHIRLLEEQGRKQEAMVAVGTVLNASLAQQDQNLGTLAAAWKRLGENASWAWDQMKAVGRKETVDDKLHAAQAAYAQAQLDMGGNQGNTVEERQANLRRTYAALQKAWDASIEEQKGASHKAEMARIQEEGIAGAKVTEHALQQYDKNFAYQKKVHEQLLAFAAQEAAGSPVSIEDQRKIMAGLATSEFGHGKKSGGGITAQVTYLDGLQKQWRALNHEATVYENAVDHISTNAEKYQGKDGQKIGEETLRLARLIDQKKYKAQADAEEIKYMGQIAALREHEAAALAAQHTADAQELQDRQFEISLTGKTAEQVERLTAAYQVQKQWKERYLGVMNARTNGALTYEEAAAQYDEIDKNRDAQLKSRNDKITAQMQPGWQTMLAGWQDTTQLMADAYNNSMNDIVRDGEDMWVQLITQGKFSARKLVDDVAAEMARLYYRQNIAGPLASFGNGILSKIFGGSVNLGTVTGADMDIFTMAHTGGIAGSSALGSKFANPAVFAGAPRFHTGGIAGNEVPIIAQKGEGIFTKEQMANLQPAGNNTHVTFAPVINIDARTDRAEVYSLVTRAVKAGQADLLDGLSRGTIR